MQPSVNNTTIKTAPRSAIDQLGHSLVWMIHAFAEAKEDKKIFMAKWDVKDMFFGKWPVARVNSGILHMSSRNHRGGQQF
jgi:hypothetical protein